MIKIDLITIGKRIKELRTSTNTSKEALIKYLGISESDLEKIESGTIDSLNADIVEKISDLYFCPVEYILTGNNPIKNRVDFNYAGFDKDRLDGMAKIFRITKNQIWMDEVLEDTETKDLEAEEIYKQRWTGLSVDTNKFLKQNILDDTDIETEEEKRQREFEGTQLDEYFFNDFNPYGL